MTSSAPGLEAIVPQLEQQANQADSQAVWPAESWQLLREAGCLRWIIPAEYGGDGLAGPTLLEHYERLAAACLTTAFILSQREGACRRIRDHGSEAVRNQWLPKLARGEVFFTIGLSHLTTSRQHVQPAVMAQETGDGFYLDGTIPWVTGAEKADAYITGGVLPDGRQILALLARTERGVTVGPPLDLMALVGSLTAQVHCERVWVDRQWLLAGPSDRVLETGKSSTGGLETSCLALGLAGAALAYLVHESQVRPELRASTQRLEQTRQALREEVVRLARYEATAKEAAILRARANSLVLRATQAALTAAKGTGFLRDHPAQRWARQAMFFLVWSCPRPAMEATLGYLAPLDEGCATE
jgi:alkylation response protein AidB-like acyl-CoA dehydrogenase